MINKIRFDPYNLVLTSGLCLEYLLTGFILVGLIRRKTFHYHFMLDHFETIHRKATGDTVLRGSYPDMGEGYYSNRLDYNRWLRFNIAQRIHYDFLEHIVPYVLFNLIGSLYWTTFSNLSCAIYIVARLFYLFSLTSL